jgi:NitT/TauT family transport system substrate-binding protein
MKSKSTIGLVLATVMFSAGPTLAQKLDKLSIVVFLPPSRGAFLPPIIKAQKLDEKNGLSITFQERTPGAYTAQFNSGEFLVGGSAALLTVGFADVRGVKERNRNELGEMTVNKTWREHLPRQEKSTA